MKELGSWIPQLFYDLIGRAAPGAFLTFLAAVLLVEPPRLAQLASSPAVRLPTTILVCLGLVISYMVGIVLGSIASVCTTREWSTRRVELITAEVPPHFNAPKMTAGEIAFLYDFLHFRNPAAGARLAKLRAEQNLCGVLLVGTVVLATAYVIRQGHQIPWLQLTYVLLGLGGVALGAYAFYVHLAIRARRLLMNCCKLLTDERWSNAAASERLTLGLQRTETA